MPAKGSSEIGDGASAADKACGDLSIAVDSTVTPTTVKAAETKGPEVITTRHVLLLLEMLLLTLSVMATETTISPALPRIAKQYPQYAEWTSWTIAAYNVVGAAWTPVAGRLGDIYGIKWLIITSLCVYLVGEIGCGFSRSLFLLIAFRAVQGVGMGIFVLCFTAIRNIFPPKFVPVALGVVSSMFSVGSSFGLVGGAAIIQHFDDIGARWENVFFVYIPFIVIVIVAFYFTLPDTPGKKTPIDVAGACVLCAGVVVFLIGLTFSNTRGWKSATTLAPLIIGLLLIIGFGVMELYIEEPLVNIRRLFQRDLLTAGIAMFMVGAALFSAMQVLPYLYEDKFGITNMVTVGLVMLPLGLTQLPISPIAAQVGKKVGFYWTCSASLTAMTVGFGLYIKYNDTRLQAVLLNLLIGAMMGSVMVSVLNIVSENTKPSEFGSASGTNMLLRVLGAAVGPVVANLLLNHNMDAMVVAEWVSEGSTSSEEDVVNYKYQSVPSDTGYKNAFIFIAVGSGIALFTVQFLGNKLKSCKDGSVTPDAVIELDGMQMDKIRFEEIGVSKVVDV